MAILWQALDETEKVIASGSTMSEIQKQIGDLTKYNLQKVDDKTWKVVKKFPRKK